MANLLKASGAYGARVGHKIVFTKEGAIDLYKLFIEVCYKDFSKESLVVLSEVEKDMVKIGFDWDELEQIETDYLQSLN